MNSFWLLLLPVATTFGYWSATRKRNKAFRSRSRKVRRHYYAGVNLLLNDDSDKAIHSFIKMLEVDGDTVETHLALGSLFRRRGEVDRAIRIHQNLVSKFELKHDHRADALFALAKDYLSAGLLDRAEKLFLELLELEAHIKASNQALVYIYQQEKEWLKAIGIMEKQTAYESADRIALAHYHCEQAQLHLRYKETEKVLRHLRKAIILHPACARARLSLSDLQLARGNYRAALRYLHPIREKAPDWLLPAIPKLQDSYLALQRADGFINYLQEILDHYPHMPILTLLAEQIRQHHGDIASLHFVTEHIRTHPTLSGLQHWLSLQTSIGQITHESSWQLMHELISRLSTRSQDYRCANCGYSGHTLHWQCPSCKTWESVKPAYLL